MSRLTGKEVYSLMEAYQAVYTPQEITEEQVWEGVENWVNSLLEEGYDLSDYTWEEMYEGYITELMADRPKYNPNFNVPQPKSSSNPVSDFLNAPNVRQNATNARIAAQNVTPSSQKYKSSSDGKNYKNYNDALAAKNSRDPRGAQGRQAQDDLNRVYRAGGGDAAVKGGTKLGGLLNVPGKSPMDVMVQGAKNLPPKYPTKDIPTPTPAPGLPKVNQRPGVPVPPVRPVPGAPVPSVRPAPAAPAPRPAATPDSKMGGDPMDQFARNFPKLAAKVKPGQSGYNTIRTRLDADNDRQENYDAYDLVFSYLINEGYANTQDSALAIMANMSEDWKRSIVEAKKT